MKKDKDLIIGFLIGLLVASIAWGWVYIYHVHPAKPWAVGMQKEKTK